MKQRVHKFFVNRAIVFVILAVIVAAGFYLYKMYQISQIDSFDKCVKAGYPVMESYPPQCRANGKTFVGNR